MVELIVSLCQVNVMKNLLLGKIYDQLYYNNLDKKSDSTNEELVAYTSMPDEELKTIVAITSNEEEKSIKTKELPCDFNIENRLMYVYKRYYKYLDEKYNNLLTNNYDINSYDFCLMGYAHQYKEVTVNYIKRHKGLDKETSTKHYQELIKRGYVILKANKQSNCYSLSKLGLEVYYKIHKDLDKIDKEALRGLHRIL